MYAKWLQMHYTKPCSTKSRTNGNQYAIQYTNIYVWYIHRLLFDETILGCFHTCLI